MYHKYFIAYITFKIMYLSNITFKRYVTSYYSLSRWQASFYFTLLVFTGSKPVRRSNKQSKSSEPVDQLSDKNY